MNFMMKNPNPVLCVCLFLSIVPFTLLDPLTLAPLLLSLVALESIPSNLAMC